MRLGKQFEFNYSTCNPVPVSACQFYFWLVAERNIFKFCLIFSLSPIRLFRGDIKTQE